MRRLSWLILGLTLAAVSPVSTQSNCITINGITRCTAPWQIYDGSARQVSVPVLDLTQVWNNPATTFTGLKLNITDNGSASASLLLDLQVAGVSKFKVDKSGNVTPVGVGLFPDGTSAAPSIAFINQAGLGLYRSAANVITATNGTSKYVSISSSAGIVLASTLAVGFAGTADSTASVDTQITRAGAGEISIGSTAVTFATLGTPGNGAIAYCTDCTEVTPASCPATQASCVCAGSGAGAFARRVNGAWYCTF